MRAKISIILKLICIGAVIYGCFTISEGLRTFTKFTTLSNLGIGIAVLLVLLHEIKLKKDILIKPSQGKYIFKFVMTVAILITFIIFLTVLAPTNSKGFIGAYLNNYCGSMAHHFIAPITAIIDFFVFDRNYQPKLAHAFYSMIFPIVYVIYIVILSFGGYRWAHGMHAPYNFLNFGAPTGWWGFDLSQLGSTSLGIGVGYLLIALLIIFLLLGFGMIAIKKMILKLQEV